MLMVGAFRAHGDNYKPSVGASTPSLHEMTDSNAMLVNWWSMSVAKDRYWPKDVKTEHGLQLERWKKILKPYLEAQSFEDARNAVDEVFDAKRLVGAPRAMRRSLTMWAAIHLPTKYGNQHAAAVAVAAPQVPAAWEQIEFKYATSPEVEDHRPLIYQDITASLMGPAYSIEQDVIPQLRDGANGIFKKLWDESNFIAELAGIEARFYEGMIEDWGLTRNLKKYVEQIVPVRDGLGNETGATRVALRPMRFDNLRSPRLPAHTPYIGTGVEQLTGAERDFVQLIHATAKAVLENYSATSKTGTAKAISISSLITGVRVDEPDTLRRVLPAKLAERIIALETTIRTKYGTTNADGEIEVTNMRGYADALVQAGIGQYHDKVDTSVPGQRTRVAGLVWTVPARWVEEEFQTSTYRTKMEAAGRDMTKLTMGHLVQGVRDQLDSTRTALRGRAPWFLTTRREFMPHMATFSPKYFGMGYLGPEAIAVEAALNADIDEISKEKAKVHREALARAYAHGRPRGLNEVSGPMFKYLFDLHGLTFTDAASALREVARGDHASVGISPTLNYPGVVSLIQFALRKQLIARKADQARGADVSGPLAKITDPMALARALRDVTNGFRDKEFNSTIENPKFQGYHETYRQTGFKPSGDGIAESMHRYVTETLTATKKKILLNQAALQVDASGAPVMIPDPNTEFGGDYEMIQPKVWDILAARLIQHTGEKADPNLTSREEVARIVAKTIAPRENKSRWKRVASPIPSISAFYTLIKADEAPMDYIFAGGAVAGHLKQILNNPWKDAFGIIDAIVEINTWMKVLALQFSLFFTIAGLESLTGVSGGKIWWGQKIPFVGTIAMLVDIRKQIKARDPYWEGLMRQAQGIGITFSETTNPMDLPMDVMRRRAEKIGDTMSKYAGAKTGALFRDMFMSPQLQTDIIFDGIFNTFKLWSVHHIAQRERANAEAAGQEFDFQRHMAPFANYIDSEVGGVNANRYAHLTPTWQRNWNLGLFSWRWTLGAWNAAGGGAITQGVLGNYLTPEESKHIFARRWPAMFLYVMVLVPTMVQGMAYLVGQGDDDEEKEHDEWLMFMNERNRKFHADVTPLLRQLPWFEGAPTGERRQYIRWGKQAYEVIRWLENPWKSFLSKQSQISRFAIEMATGSSVGSSDWDLGFKDMGLAGLVVDSDGGFMESRLGYTIQKFAPFTVLAWAKQADAFPLQILGPTSKGLSFHGAVEAYQGYLETWSRKQNYSSIYKNRKIKANLEALGADILDAAERNGYDTKKLINSARGAVLKDMYGELFRAIEAGDKRRIDRVSSEIARVNGTIQSVRSSFKNRNDMYGRKAKLTEEQKAAIDEAFKRP
tara:strand:- start:3 stop:4055 length:4053 start_codon:yes stop_codon:yes gene_type:complete